MEPDEAVLAAQDLLARIPPVALRMARGNRSCGEVASDAGLTRQAVFSYEKGARRPTGIAAYRYARALGFLAEAK